MDKGLALKKGGALKRDLHDTLLKHRHLLHASGFIVPMPRSRAATFFPSTP